MEKPLMVEVLSKYSIKVGRNKKCLCPFHKEKTASFSIKDTYYNCFSCGVKGDSIDFVMKIENCNFKEALKILNLNTHKKINYYEIERKREKIKKDKYNFLLNMFVSFDLICKDNEPRKGVEPNYVWIVSNELREEYWEELLKCN